MPQPVRRLAILLVAFTLALPLSAAAFPDLASRRAEITAPGLLSQFWGWLTGTWAEVGCSIDPSGRTCAAPQADEGCGIDPNGHHCPATPSQAEVGCGIDPDGRTCATPQTDAGCGIDPNGHHCPGAH